MKQNILTVLASLSLVLTCAGQTSPKFENYGTIVDFPNIDATIFLNAGPFSDSGFISSGSGMLQGSYIIPYTTLNTLYYTNLPSGTMSYADGFRFEFITNGIPQKTFYTVNQGEISGGFLYANSTNIYNTGILNGDGGGVVRLLGDYVNLYRGGITAALDNRSSSGLGGMGGGMGGGGGGMGGMAASNARVATTWYGKGDGNQLGDRPRDMTFASFNLPKPASPLHEVVEFIVGIGDMTNVVTVPSSPMSTGWVAVANTNQVNPSNLVVQVIFYPTNVYDTNLTIRAGFSATRGDLEGGSISIVEFQAADYDIVRGTPFTNFFYFLDYACTTTNVDYYTNALTGQVERPEVYRMSQGFRNLYPKMDGNTPFTNTLLDNNTYSNKNATNYYFAWAGEVGPLRSVVGDQYQYSSSNPALLDNTNQSGRIEIKADKLDLTKARLRAGSLISIETPNLLSSSNALFDSPVFSFDITVTNPTMTVSNFIKPTVKKISGDLYAYSAVWTNQTGAVQGSGETATTNVVDIRFHVLVFDQFMTGETPVVVDRMLLHANNIVLNDSFNIQKSAIFDCASLTVGNVFDAYGFEGWASTNFPRTVSFTNLNSLYVYGTANFGQDKPAGLENFSNHGTIDSTGVKVWANNLENSGTLIASEGSIALQSSYMKLDGGKLLASSDITIKGSDIKMKSTKLNASTLNIEALQRLSDAGPSTNNAAWFCTNGFNLLFKPQAGDLLGTSITSSVAKFKEVRHVWAGENRGVSVAGFSNNAAVGKLSINVSQLGLATFAPATGNNALYVDYLELKNYATNVDESIQIDPGMAVYFASANVAVTNLDGKFGGRLRWLPSYAGYFSSTNLTLPSGQVIRVNLSLLKSTSLDSDADGVVNASDKSPFDGVKLNISKDTNDPPQSLFISWNAAAATAYQVQYSTNFVAPQWQLLINYTNTATTNKAVTLQEPLQSNMETRYYRVNYAP